MKRDVYFVVKVWVTVLGLFATNKCLARMKNTFNFVISLKLIKVAF